MLQIFAIIDDTSVMNFRKNLQHNFPKMRGGSKAVWNFSENSSVLEGECVPYGAVLPPSLMVFFLEFPYKRGSTEISETEIHDRSIVYNGKNLQYTFLD